MKKWLWIAGLVIAGAYFAKPIVKILSGWPIIGGFFTAKKTTDFTA